MPFKNRALFKWYFKLYYFVAKKRIAYGDLSPKVMHTQLVVVLSTGLLMWGYAFLAWITISSPVPGIVGFIASLVHLSAPLFFRLTRNSFFTANLILGAGLFHQGTFAFYTGGFESNILIWYGILPLIGGVCAGRRGAITWTIITISVSLIFFLLFKSGYPFPNLITQEGFVIAQSFLVFGWIFLSSTIVIVYTGITEHTERILEEQGHKIDELFRVLFHDLANPLGRLSIGLSIAKRNIQDEQSNRGLEIATAATDSMLEITQNIRRMYAVRRGKAHVDLTATSLNSAVEYLTKIFANELKAKGIALTYDFKKHQDVSLMVEPVSFKNQVLGNIISNSIKFSHKDSEITLSVRNVSETEVELEIRDQGIGIPSSVLPHLFDINKKSSRRGTEGEQGSGLGMSIAKSFIDMYGGLILVESKENNGTVVKLRLKGQA